MISLHRLKTENANDKMERKSKDRKKIGDGFQSIINTLGTYQN